MVILWVIFSEREIDMDILNDLMERRGGESARYDCFSW